MSSPHATTAPARRLPRSLAALAAGSLLAGLVTSTAAPASGDEVAADYQFTCDDGTATITAYLGDGGDLLIPEVLGGCPVTSIDVRVFQGLGTTDRALGHVTIPDSVTTIETRAFDRAGLTGLTLGSSPEDSGLQTIGAGAFDHASIGSLTLPDAVESIGDFAFTAADLTELTIGSSPEASALRTIGAGAFEYNDLTELTLGESIEIIRGNAFAGNALTDLVLPDSVTTIAGYAFYDNELRTVSFGTSEGARPITLIDASAFDRNALTEVTFHAPVESIHWSAFRTPEREDADFLGWYADPEFTRRLDGFPAAITAEDVPRSVHGRWSDTVLTDFAGTCVDGRATLTAYRGDGGDIAIPRELHGCAVGVIGEAVFQGLEEADRALGRVSVPGSVTTIEDRAFENSGLTAIEFESSDASALTRIGERAFFGNRLETLDLPDALRTIGDRAFVRNMLTGVRFGTSQENSGLESIGAHAFGGQATFGRGNRISEVTLPHSLTFLGENAFMSNAITTLDLGAGLETIGTLAFGYNELAELTVPGTVTTIGARAFDENKIADLTLGEGVETLGALAFSGNSLTTVTLPDSLRTIGDGAFYDNRLTSVALGASPESSQLETIDVDAFAGNSFFPPDGNQIEHLTIPATVTSIGEDAFAHNALRSLTFAGPVESVDAGAFRPQHRAEPTGIDGWFVFRNWYGWHTAPIGGEEADPFPTSIEAPVTYYSRWDDSPTSWGIEVELGLASHAPDAPVTGQPVPLEVRVASEPAGLETAGRIVELWGRTGEEEARRLAEAVVDERGASTLTFPSPRAGEWELWAVQPGEGEEIPEARSAGLGLEVGRAETAIEADVAPRSGAAGLERQARVEVTAAPPGAGTPGGAVTVSVRSVDPETGEPHGSEPVWESGTTELAGGVAEVPVGLLPSGTYAVGVSYEGDAHYRPSETIAGNFVVEAPVFTAPESGEAGQEVTFTGSGFLPAEEIAIELRSAPVLLAELNAGPDGSFSATTVLPADLEAGEHTLWLLSGTAELSRPFHVTPAPAEPNEPPTEPNEPPTEGDEPPTEGDEPGPEGPDGANGTTDPEETAGRERTTDTGRTSDTDTGEGADEQTGAAAGAPAGLPPTGAGPLALALAAAALLVAPLALTARRTSRLR